MPSMGYCRWENTSADMSQCVDAQRAFNEREDDGSSEPEGCEVANDDTRTNFEALNDFERRGYYECLRLAAQMLEQATPEDLDVAGVNLTRLAA